MYSEIFLGTLVFAILAYLGYRWYIVRSGFTDFCTTYIINTINSWSTSKTDWPTACNWLNSININCNDKNFALKIDVTVPGNATRTYVYKNDDGILTPDRPLFPSCSEDYPSKGMTLTATVNGHTVSKSWPPSK